ncbi:MAG: bifunctional riboflavin kinase/FAD synthetase [Clostridia bacterium]|nr:bifunctional riboflavin kinase/FAD synthetase [Clostridia bacterium]
MQLIKNDYKKVNIAGGTAVAIGNFDGVHKGHQKMLDTLKKVSYDLGVPSVVYTFSEHPLNVFSKKSQTLIYSNEKKAELIEKSGIHTLFFEDFSSVRGIEAEDFVKEILINKFNISAVVIGEDGRFGKSGKGDAALLKEVAKTYGFSVHVVESVKVGEVVCSSTKIRERISSGDVVGAAEMLTRSYSLSGVVIADKQLGRTYGYPTANIVLDDGYIAPKRGVYATNVYIDGRGKKAITNVGTTSFDKEEKERIESHILDFSGDLYGKKIEVEFLYYMRDFKNFVTVDELKNQLDEDKKTRKLGGNL